MYLGRLVPVLPSTPSEVVKGSLKQGHHNLIADRNERNLVPSLRIGYAPEIALLKPQIRHGREVGPPSPAVERMKVLVVLLVVLLILVDMQRIRVRNAVYAPDVIMVLLACRKYLDLVGCGGGVDVVRRRRLVVDVCGLDGLCQLCRQ